MSDPLVHELREMLRKVLALPFIAKELEYIDRTEVRGPEGQTLVDARALVEKR